MPSQINPDGPAHAIERESLEDEPKPANATATEAFDDGAPAPQIAYSLFTARERWTIVALIALAGWFSTSSSFIYYPAITAIARDLNSTVSLINTTVTAYLVVSGIAPSIVGDAADSYGRRPLYIILLTLYVASNVGIALQRSFAALLVLRMLQSAAISGTFSIAYGVVADIAAPSERGAYVGIISFGITTAPSVAPAIAGALANGPGWSWIFWFLAIASGSSLIAMALILPETNRALVGNGGMKPAIHSQPFIGKIMRPWSHEDRGLTLYVEPPARNRPNPLRSLMLLRRKDTAVVVVAVAVHYTVYSCIHASLSTTFMVVYGLDQLQAGLIYLPFGVGAIISTLVSSKWIDRDYRLVAKAHGLSINKVSGDDLLRFPIEEARMRSVFWPAMTAVSSVIAYGWLVHHKVHLAGPLTLLFLAGWSIQTCFNINNTLLVDINQDFPATAQASSNLVRCLLSGLFVAVLQQLIDGVGFGWTFTIFGLLCLVPALMCYLELKQGRRWRLARHGLSIAQVQSEATLPGSPQGTSPPAA